MKAILLITLNLLFLSASVLADTYSPYKFEMLQGLTQSSDTVVTATIESVAVGVRGDIYKDTTDTQVKCVVNDVYLGAKELKNKNKTITVIFGAGDSPIAGPSINPVLLFLRKENNNFRLSFFHTHGVFRLEKGIVQVWFEGKLFGSLYSLREIVARVKKYSKSKVEVTTEVADNILLSDDYLPVTFKFKNIGKKSVLLLPPSYCFDSLRIKKTIVTNRQGKKSWYGVGHWDIVPKLEPLLTLEVGAERTYTYWIPLEELDMTTADEYRVNFDYHPYRLSKWADQAQITDKQMQRVWLGVTRETSRIFSVR